MSKKKIEDLDLYGLLDIQITATEGEIKKAYRKKALLCHPDKNPDDPKAAETFHELSNALEILTDTAARAAYDKVIRAKAAAKLRHKELDSKRQKLKEDLERREHEASSGLNLTDEQKLAAEIARLQKEGSRLLQEEQQRVKEEVQRTINRLNEPVWDSSLNRLKISWKVDKDDESNGGYDESNLRRFLKKYGEIVAIIMSPRKKGSALVEFASKEASEMALEFEKGLPENPLKFKWVNNRPILTTMKDKPAMSSVVTDRDYESLVLTRIRQAAERQRIIDEMMKEDQQGK
ncbi:jg25606 [Pararge aegeria aegeria]|uniref:DnaJ homolog subfamily C member 17 n=2 Tax=Pararge aegeria TaxID=116150 RepID=A0A8S4RBK5_9NEOP|nr:jg25606 [Pararge aegeria aegeria]